MNKKLMAVAVAGALTAPGLAVAQVGGSPGVSLYGRLDTAVMIQKFSTDGAGAISELKKNDIFSPGNALGFRGREVLGWTPGKHGDQRRSLRRQELGGRLLERRGRCPVRHLGFALQGGVRHGQCGQFGWIRVLRHHHGERRHHRRFAERAVRERGEQRQRFDSSGSEWRVRDRIDRKQHVVVTPEQ